MYPGVKWRRKVGMSYGALKGVTSRGPFVVYRFYRRASVRAQSNNRLSVGLNVENLRSLYESFSHLCRLIPVGLASQLPAARNRTQGPATAGARS